jgi:hypothetical protein
MYVKLLIAMKIKPILCMIGNTILLTLMLLIFIEDYIQKRNTFANLFDFFVLILIEFTYFFISSSINCILLMQMIKN